MENLDIAKVFYEIADLLEIKGENPFRIRSYRNAGLVIEGLPVNIKSIVERNEEELEEIPGIGESLHEKIVEILKTGKSHFHQELLRELSPSLLDLLKVSGVGPKKVKLFYDELGIKSIEELEKAATAGKLRGLPGMGEKSEEKILKGIKSFQATVGRFGLAVGLSYADQIVEYLKKTPGVIDAVPAGSLRRWKETIGDLDILVTAKKASTVMDRFVSFPDVASVVAKGDTKTTVMLKNGMQTDVRVLDKKSFGAALQYFTGSKAHNVALRDRANRMGLKISEYGVFREKDEKWIAGEKEEDVYKAVGLPYIPPELRENRGEIGAAEKGKLPKLIEVDDIKGDLHIHTKASDGGNTIEVLAEYAVKKGYEYIAITDHSKAVGIAHGLNEERLLKQIEEIDRFNKRLTSHGSPFTVLKGTEVDIKGDGTLDHSEEALKKLDVVVATVHSKFNMTEEDMTKRIINAIETGLVHVIAHPTGRLLTGREPYPVNMEKLLEAAKKHNVAMEVNAYPDRLDLNDVHCKMAKDMGVMLVISTDTHHYLQMDYMRFGVNNARRGWVEKKDVLNTRPLNELLKMINR
ncbi:MAG: DNA polymerase/3'-5' exonuclease PolX [Deltaproteobacteria bacterium]|nr:DNA polymerase/3'-5' exonuclease PolX [Deltaproteobacteria bacterium]